MIVRFFRNESCFLSSVKFSLATGKDTASFWKCPSDGLLDQVFDVRLSNHLHPKRSLCLDVIGLKLKIIDWPSWTATIMRLGQLRRGETGAAAIPKVQPSSYLTAPKPQEGGIVRGHVWMVQVVYQERSRRFRINIKFRLNMLPASIPLGLLEEKRGLMDPVQHPKALRLLRVLPIGERPAPAVMPAPTMATSHLII